MKIQLFFFVVSFLCLHATLVYIGGGDNSPGAFDGYLAAPQDWTYVRANADGYYVNNFALNTNTTDPVQLGKLSKMSSLFTQKHCFYETDYVRSTDTEDEVKIDILRLYFDVNQATLNEGYSGSRIAALQWRAWRPVLAMGAPWLIDGDINSTAGAPERDAIDHMSGSSTDGPLGLWARNQGSMQSGSYSIVHYSHTHQKQAMVMLATYQSGSGANYLSIGQNCVRGHEDNNASPDIWAISYYAAQLEQYPVTPEQVNGQPAGTVTGLGFWLIHHLKGQALLEIPDFYQSSMGKVEIPINLDGSPLSQYNMTVKIVHADEDWLDICPVLHVSKINLVKPYWDVKFFLSDQDVTSMVMGEQGLACVGDLRLWPNQAHLLTVVFTLSTQGKVLTEIEPVQLHFKLMTHPKQPSDVLQEVVVQTKIGIIFNPYLSDVN